MATPSPIVIGKTSLLRERQALFVSGTPVRAILHGQFVSPTKGQAAIRETARAMIDRTGNLPALPAIFPDQSAPVIRLGGNGRELVTMRSRKYPDRLSTRST